VTYRPTARQQLDKNILATNAHATTEGYPLLVNRAVKMVFSMGSVPRLYNESLFVAIKIRSVNWNWEFRSCRSIEQYSEDNWLKSSELTAAGNGKKGIRPCSVVQ
jgi:hypothetical protein